MKKFFFLLALLASTSAFAENVILKKGASISSQIKKSDTVYEVRDAFSLNNGKLIMPKGASLIFNGGKISKGTIVGNGTVIKNPCFDDVKFRGTFDNETLTVSHASFGKKVDLFGILSSFGKACVFLEEDINNVPACEQAVQNVCIKGNGHSIKLQKFLLGRGVYFNVSDVVFDCSEAKDDFIYAIGGNGKSFCVENCGFVNIGERNLLTVRGYSDVEVRNNTFEGQVSSKSSRSRLFSCVVLLYDCKGEVSVCSNKFHKCFGIAIDGIGFDGPDTRVIVSENEIDTVTNGGIVFCGGDVWNAEISRNVIRNVFCLGNSLPDDQLGAQNSAINVHGFHNLKVVDNFVENCLNTGCFDFDGTGPSGMIEKGNSLLVSGNCCNNVLGTSFFGVENAIFENNEMVSGKWKEGEYAYFISVIGSRNVEVRGNDITSYKPSKGNVFPVYIADTQTIQSGKVDIHDNSFVSEGSTFLLSNAKFSGKCTLKGNKGHILNDASAVLTYAFNSPKENLELLDEDQVYELKLDLSKTALGTAMRSTENLGRGVKSISFSSSKNAKLSGTGKLSIVSKTADGKRKVLWSTEINSLKKGATSFTFDKYIHYSGDCIVVYEGPKANAIMNVALALENQSSVKYY